MRQNKLTFKDTNLTVDWIGFKFQNLDNFAQTNLAEYLFKIGFNSYQESGKLAKPVKESILISSKNKFEVCFFVLLEIILIGRAPYLTFLVSRLNANLFYSLAQKGFKVFINWEIFSSAILILGRFDLNYVENYVELCEKQ